MGYDNNNTPGIIVSEIHYYIFMCE
jgi:hypothetical protein